MLCGIRKQPSHPDQIVSGQAQLEHPANQFLTAITRLSLPAYCLEPTKDFFNPCATPQTDGVSLASCGAAVDRTRPALGILRHMWCDVHRAFLNEITRVVSFCESLRRLRILETSPHLERIEVIVVDDCSTDSSPQVIERFKKETEKAQESNIRWTFLGHDHNCGKGQAVKTALELATCEICVIHDADLEYHPKDLLRIVEVFVEEQPDAVYGSRFAGGESRRILLYRHELGNRFLQFRIPKVDRHDCADCGNFPAPCPALFPPEDRPNKRGVR